MSIVKNIVKNSDVSAQVGDLCTFDCGFIQLSHCGQKRWYSMLPSDGSSVSFGMIVEIYETCRDARAGNTPLMGGNAGVLIYCLSENAYVATYAYNITSILSSVRASRAQSNLMT